MIHSHPRPGSRAGTGAHGAHEGNRLTPKQIRLLLARLKDETLVLLEREDGHVDLEVNPLLVMDWEGME